MNQPCLLVVEDNATQQRVMEILAKRYGYQTYIVSSGRKALEVLAAADNTVSCVLMDWYIEDMDGPECTQKIRDMDRQLGRHTPVIAMTGRDSDGTREACMEAGMDDYLCKPFTVEQFKNVVEHYSGSGS